MLILVNELCNENDSLPGYCAVNLVEADRRFMAIAVLMEGVNTSETSFYYENTWRSIS
jgi:hypothetical protein